MPRPVRFGRWGWMSPGTVSLCRKGVFNSALNRAASAASGLADEASATRSSKESKAGFCHRSAEVSACGLGRELSCARHEENAIPKVRLQYRTILAATARFTRVSSNIPPWRRRGAFLRDDLRCNHPAMQARRPDLAGRLKKTEPLETEKRSNKLPNGGSTPRSLKSPRRFPQ